MSDVRYFVVDAFTDRLFSGNPAGVCLLEGWPEDSVLLHIAAENNLSETAFLVKQSDGWDLRWFTPTMEVDLCGHATLASAFVLMNLFDRKINRADFFTKSGHLSVDRENDQYVLDFPSRPPVPCPAPDLLEKALGARVLETHLSRDLLVLLNSEKAVKELSPDIALLNKLPGILGIIVTAKGESADFVSRFFAPMGGIPEDPVTGSSHSTLIPFWSGRLGKKNMEALQLSARGGRLSCKDCGDRVRIGGRAVLYLTGEIPDFK
jgi:PhzF family phenazine biosynthesis protein